MKRTAIVTLKLLTTANVRIIIEKGWYIHNISDGVATCYRQLVREFDEETNVSEYMKSRNVEGAKVIAYKINFGPGKVGLIWNEKTKQPDTWLRY